MSELDPERQEKAREYARISRRLWLVDVLINGAYSMAWLTFAWGPAVRDWLVGQWPALQNPWLLVPAFAAVFGLPLSLINLPLTFHGGYTLPHRYGQSTQTVRGWISDQLKGLLVGVPLGLVLLELLFLALRVTGDLWWLWTAGGLLIFNVLLSNLAPVLIMPLFNKYVPLGEQHEELRQRLLRLAEKAGARVRGVYKFDMSRRTKAANAALTGIGNTRRIILGDTLLNEFTTDEIETVLAHELGHHVHRDILLFIAVGALTTAIGLYAASVVMKWAVAAFGLGAVSSPAALPALTIVLGAYGLVTMPLGNGVSRWREAMADRFALKLTGKGEAFAAAFVRLANQNLSEVDPEPWVVWLFHSHPPLGQRIGRAKAWAKNANAAANGVN